MNFRIPSLETERLLIRDLTMEDLEPIHRILNEAFGNEIPLDERKRWLTWTILGYEMCEMLEQPHYGERGIFLKETGALIGAVGVVAYLDTFRRVPAFNRPPNAPATAEVGLFWVIDPAHQRKGYAPEAARALVNFLFEEYRLGRIIATTAYENLASQSVMRKIGMKVEYIERPEIGDTAVIGVIQRTTI